jgi:hypothetical protein
VDESVPGSANYLRPGHRARPFFFSRTTRAHTADRSLISCEKKTSQIAQSSLETPLTGLALPPRVLIAPSTERPRLMAPRQATGESRRSVGKPDEDVTGSVHFFVSVSESRSPDSWAGRAERSRPQRLDRARSEPPRELRLEEHRITISSRGGVANSRPSLGALASGSARHEVPRSELSQIAPNFVCLVLDRKPSGP